MDIKEKIVDILHKHYYPTMHESIADCTLIECADEILTLIKEAGYRKTEGKLVRSSQNDYKNPDIIGFISDEW